MARGFNKVILMGNLARSPELKYTADRTAYAKFAVAVNQAWKDKNGELQESVDFIPVTVWGAMAENCEKYLKKGSRALVEGRIQVRKYEGKDGESKYATDVVASGVTFLGDGQSREFSSEGEKFDGGIENEEDEDLPF